MDYLLQGVTTQTVEIFLTVTPTHIVWDSELTAISYIYISTISCIITKISNFVCKWSFRRYKLTCQNSLILWFLCFSFLFLISVTSFWGVKVYFRALLTLLALEKSKNTVFWCLYGVIVLNKWCRKDFFRLKKMEGKIKNIKITN